MKVIFLLDNNETFAVDPETLQLRQLAPGQSALGLPVSIPNPENPDQPTQGFRPLINYPVNLALPDVEHSSNENAATLDPEPP